ncbi:hypothetical protein GCM10010969_02870 [Saccharibacillus kuerlensis]|uniref:Uncharacterized protein n=1 Tax=Saccharibacillus kuerlensis TaxID=459527 RepID=A0ABQ2KSZ4_9BACL|nr:hypothetical protein GCM10010969_02870 [Saccharibacillus kuerlensis]
MNVSFKGLKVRERYKLIPAVELPANKENNGKGENHDFCKVRKMESVPEVLSDYGVDCADQRNYVYRSGDKWRL